MKLANLLLLGIMVQGQVHDLKTSVNNYINPAIYVELPEQMNYHHVSFIQLFKL